MKKPFLCSGFGMLIAVALFLGVTSSVSETFAAGPDDAQQVEVPVPYNNGNVPVNTAASARRMIVDLMQTYGDDYTPGTELLARLSAIDTQLADDPTSKPAAEALQTVIRDAALANPLLSFDRVVAVRRDGEANRNLNAYTSDTIRRTGRNNEISIISGLSKLQHGESLKIETLYKPEDDTILKHLDLHFSGERLLFSGVGENGNWAVMEIDAEGKNLKELTPADQKDVQWFDACYLPEQDNIIVCSTAGMQGLPCVNGSQAMANLYKMNTMSGDVRQLTFEQDSDWHPRVLANGQVLYLRWEYTDTMHYFSRYLFHMNPDGTGQFEFWGSGSYFPSAYNWPQPIPGKPSMLVGTVGGHHAKSETGRLVIIDRSLSRKYPYRNDPEDKIWGPENSVININTRTYPAEETGCVQEIPGWGRDVVGNVRDGQGDGMKYIFQNPYPLSEKYFLTSLRGAPGANGGKYTLCLVDVFDNMTVLYEGDEYKDIFEPIPLRERETPPVLVDRTFEGQPATIFCTNVYDGRGLQGVPHGKVKSLRVFAYHYGYMKSGGHESVGLETGWDIKRILGTVPVEEDGSFSFFAPANTPLAIQPLDEDGAALQLMRSWMTAMPGERLACNGCHEDQNEVVPARMVKAALRAPSQIEPWHGEARPLAFETDVKPVLDKFCVGCHNEETKAEKGRISFAKTDPNNWKNDQAYLDLCAYTRHWGPESELDMYYPMEWHASTSLLVQMLKKGHHGVELDADAWDRLYTWIDLNSPHRGMWNNQHYEERRLELAELYAGLSDNPEEEHRRSLALLETMAKIEPIIPPKQQKPGPDGLSVSGFPFKAEQPGETLSVDLGEGVKMQLVKVPAGSYVMGDQKGDADESPRAVVSVGKSFFMGQTEVTNREYNIFDPKHDTRYLDETGKDHSVPGYIANHPDQPVSRIAWQEAMSFCDWLSKKSGKKVTLPTESQWEWAARAGNDQQFFYGDDDTDFSQFANLADASRRRLYVTWDGGSKVHIRRDYPADYLYPLRDDRFTDKWIVVDFVKQYDPSPFGLYDMVGNVSEWTRSDYRPYPYTDDDGRNAGDLTTKKVARGGSWNDRPSVAGSTVRFPFESYQKVYNVGFRVIIEE